MSEASDRIVSLLPPSRDLDVGHGARRRAVRFGIAADVEARCGALRAKGFTLNISGGGLRVGLDLPVEVGDRLDLLIETGQRRYRERATVVWTRRRPDGCVAGLAFDA